MKREEEKKRFACFYLMLRKSKYRKVQYIAALAPQDWKMLVSDWMTLDTSGVRGCVCVSLLLFVLTPNEVYPHLFVPRKPLTYTNL